LNIIKSCTATGTSKANAIMSAMITTMQHRPTRRFNLEKIKMNYFFDNESRRLEVYAGDLLLVELPYCDAMTEAEAELLAIELFNQSTNL
jgi:hypothetical protein